MINFDFTAVNRSGWGVTPRDLKSFSRCKSFEWFHTLRGIVKPCQTSKMEFSAIIIKG